MSVMPAEVDAASTDRVQGVEDAAEASATAAPAQLDLAVPTEDTWSEDARRVYAELAEKLTEEDGWERKAFLVDANDPSSSPRVMTRCDREQTGNFYNYAYWLNGHEQKLCGVIEFGPYLQGPPGCAHGGATASIADACMGSTVYYSGRRAVTANLTVNYRNFVQLGRPYLIESSVEREDGRKVFADFQLSTTDRSVACVQATGLFVTARKN